MGLFKKIGRRASAAHPNGENEEPGTSFELQNPRKPSSVSLVPLSDVTEASLKVWRQLPNAIRHDPSMISFQQEHDRWKAEHGEQGEGDDESMRRSFVDDGNGNEGTSSSHQKKSDKKVEIKTGGDDSDSDNGEFITIKVTNEEGGTDLEEVDQIKEGHHHKPREVKILHESKELEKSHPVVNNQKEALTHDDHHEENKEHLKENPFHKFGKTGFLVVVWIFMVMFLSSTPEKVLDRRQLAVPIAEARIFTFPKLPSGTRINSTLSGAFSVNETTIENQQKAKKTSVDFINKKVNETVKENYIRVYLQTSSGRALTHPKIFAVTPPAKFDTATPVKLPVMFDIGEDNLWELKENNQALQLYVESNFTKTDDKEKQEMPLIFTYDIAPINRQLGVIFAAFVLIFLYALIIYELVHRTFAAMIASTLSIALLAALNDRPTHEEIIGWIDVETILLLFSMMILVAIMSETGVFNHLAVYAYKITNGKIWPLVHSLCIITCLISMLLDNVTTVLLMAPITITLCEDLDLNPVPILMAIVVHANIGGTATPIGDPPNIIITSNPTVLDRGVTFLTFTVHMLIGVAILTFTTNLHLRLIFRDMKTLFINEPKEIKILKKHIVTWKRAAASISPFSKDANLVRETLLKKVKILRHELKKKMTKAGVETSLYRSTLEDMEKAYPIKKRGLLLKSGCVLVFMLVLFFVESFPELHRLSLGWSALIGVILLLIISGRDDMDAILHRVEFSTLLFFAAMFVLMEAVERMGFIAWIGAGCEEIIRSVNRDYRLAVAIFIIIWVSGLTSAFIDSIPVTQVMIKIVISLSVNLKLPLQPLIWALAFGPCLGGNGTLIGASANVIGAGIAEQHGYKMTFMDFFKFGFQIMIGNLVVTTLYLLACHAVLEWHPLL